MVNRKGFYVARAEASNDNLKRFLLILDGYCCWLAERVGIATETHVYQHSETDVALDLFERNYGTGRPQPPFNRREPRRYRFFGDSAFQWWACRCSRCTYKS